jgi:hypothetical protein
MGLPEDPAAFVAESERAAGPAWRKTLTSAAGDTIVADWERTEDGRSVERGIEYWRFDADGEVYEHETYGHETAEPVETPMQRLRLAWAYPSAALALLRRRKR